MGAEEAEEAGKRIKPGMLIQITPDTVKRERFGGIVGQVTKVLSGQLATTAINSVMIIFYALVMFSYDTVLTAIGIFFAGVNVFMLQWVARHRVDGYRRLTYDLGKVAGVSIAGLEAIETIKASATESDFFARWSGYY